MRTTISATISAAVVTAVSVAAVLAPATAASAKAETLKDPKRDVWTITDYDTFTKSKKQKSIDIKKSVVTHGKKRVQLKAWYVNLAKDGFESLQPMLQLKTDAGRKFVVYGYVYKQPDFPWTTSGSYYEDTSSTAQRPFVTPRGTTAECSSDRIKVAVSWKKDFVTVNLPRTCVGSPKWVRGHVDIAAFAEGDSSKVWYDQGHGKGHGIEKGWTGKLKRG